MSRDRGSAPVAFPGRDRRAVFHSAAFGADRAPEGTHVIVVGGGIAGIAAAVALADRGVRVTLFESTPRLGGRVAAWQTDDGRTMSRGFHAFFRQYYNLRTLLKRIDPDLSFLMPLDDYPLVRSDGLTESFRELPTKPPWSFIEFVRRSPSFTPRSLAKVNIGAALELLRVRFPETFTDYDGESAESFLDRLNFPEDARDLALEVFARSFFAHPSAFGAGELVAMFHTYFLGSAEGLIFDVPRDDYDTAIWEPMREHLETLGVDVRLNASVDALAVDEAGAAVTVSGIEVRGDAVVLATDPRVARSLIAGATLDGRDPGESRDGDESSDADHGRDGDESRDEDHGLDGGERRETAENEAAREKVSAWLDSVASTNNAPPFTVVRLWFDGHVNRGRPAFLGTSGYGPLDNVSVLERFEEGAAAWATQHGGSVVELHGYASPEDVMTDPESRDRFVARLKSEMERVYPETSDLGVVHEEVLIEDDCGLIGPHGWTTRPTVQTPWPALVLAGDWLRCDYPVALMERATTTGFLAANELLAGWGAKGQDIWTAPMRGLLRR